MQIQSSLICISLCCLPESLSVPWYNACVARLDIPWSSIARSISKGLPHLVSSWGLALSKLYSKKASGCPGQTQWSPLPMIPNIWTKDDGLQNQGRPLFKWISKMWHVHTMKYYSAMKRNMVLGHTITWMNLKALCKVKYARWKRTNAGWFHLYEISRVDRSRETESRVVIAKGWGRMGTENDCLMDTGSPDENVLELDRGESCTKLWVY